MKAWQKGPEAISRSGWWGRLDRKINFIKRFMDRNGFAQIEEGHLKTQIRDELPQSGTGRTITTTEPKFIPAKAVELRLPITPVSKCGWLLRGIHGQNAIGHMEDGQPRMLNTPWNEEKIPQKRRKSEPEKSSRIIPP